MMPSPTLASPPAPAMDASLVRVLVVDDSAFMRKSLTLMLESDPQIKVIATAKNGREAVDLVVRHRPDIVTLDVEMPGMDGLEALRAIMRDMPVPVLMVSSLTTEGADATLQALDLGAVDFLSKELSYVSVNIINIRDELVNKVRSLASSSALQRRFRSLRNERHGADRNFLSTRNPGNGRSVRLPGPFEAILIGISTGGPQALLQVIPALPAMLPVGIAVVQHMPPRFTHSLAQRLDSLSMVNVKEAETGDTLEPGRVLIAPGGRHLTFRREARGLSAVVADEPSRVLYKPSVDVMMCSAAGAASGPLLGVIMTGMGKDGVAGLHEIKHAGGTVVAQDEDTCVVFGMPKAALDDGVVDEVVSLDGMADMLSAVQPVGGSQ